MISRSYTRSSWRRPKLSAQQQAEIRRMVLAQQRYAKSHRILANCQGVKDFGNSGTPKTGHGLVGQFWGFIPTESLTSKGLKPTCRAYHTMVQILWFTRQYREHSENFLVHSLFTVRCNWAGREPAAAPAATEIGGGVNCYFAAVAEAHTYHFSTPQTQETCAVARTILNSPSLAALMKDDTS
jgi:hypothetical protein